MNMIFSILIINMRKVYVINDFNLKKKVEELGYRCEVMESNIEDYDKAIIVKIRNPSEYQFYEKLKDHFRNRNKILYIVFSPEVECVSENTGFKFGKWLNVTHLVKRIGDFSKAPDPVKTIHEVDAEAILARFQKY